MATIVQASITGASANDILTECRLDSLPDGRHFGVNWFPWTNGSINHMKWWNLTLVLVSRELWGAGKCDKYLSRHRLKADEIQQRKLGSLTFTCVHLQVLWLTGALNPQQSNNRLHQLLAQCDGEQKGCSIWLDWLTPQHRVADTPGIGLFTKLWLQQCNLTIATLQSDKTMVWETALRASIFNQAGGQTQRACPGLSLPRGVRHSSRLTALHYHAAV